MILPHWLIMLCWFNISLNWLFCHCFFKQLVFVYGIIQNLIFGSLFSIILLLWILLVIILNSFICYTSVGRGHLQMTHITISMWIQLRFTKDLMNTISAQRHTWMLLLLFLLSNVSVNWVKVMLCDMLFVFAVV